MKKIVILDGYTINPGDLSWDGLNELGEVSVYDRTPPELVRERIAGASLILTSKVLMDADVMDACPELKYIGVLATGYNNIDLEAASKRGIVVTNVPAYSTPSVAQYVFALLLEICHHVGHHSQEVRRSRWSSCEDFSFWDYPLIELSGKTLGIVGFGRIGQSVATIAAAMGMNVIFHARRPIEAANAEQVELDELFERSDVITLHTPLTPQTENLIRRETIQKMKDGAIIINTARGPIVSEADMAEALDNEKISYYATDVVNVEPIRKDNPLLKAKNCLITPHIAWAPKEARERLIRIVVENAAAYAQGEPINVVNETAR